MRLAQWERPAPLVRPVQWEQLEPPVRPVLPEVQVLKARLVSPAPLAPRDPLEQPEQLGRQELRVLLEQPE